MLKMSSSGTNAILIYILRHRLGFAPSHTRHRAYAASVYQRHEISSGSMCHWSSARKDEYHVRFLKLGHVHGHHR